jgi:uncharacterized protein (DUF362 family)
MFIAMAERLKVLLMRCDRYDPDKISGIIKEGMEELGVKPHGRTMFKPNVVIAHKAFFPHAFTRSEFLDGVIGGVKYHSERISELSVGERSGITLPTQYNFKEAGYIPVLKKHKVKTYYFDEEKQIPVSLKNKNAIRNNIFIPKSISQTDFLINLPKFKAHPWTRMTLALKNYIGIQDDRHRLVDHNQFLEHKLADLKEVSQSKFIAVDAIVAGEKMMLTPDPYPMGVIMMGTNSCAIDTVGCHMVNIEPSSLLHLKHTSERGFGPMDLNEIEVGGDFQLEELQHKNKDFRFFVEKVDSYFNNKGNLTCTVGKFPEKHSKDYCWGGCPGALQEAIHVYKSSQPSVLNDIKKIRYVVGQVEGDLKLEKDEKVLFAGDCAQFKGKINGSYVTIDSIYKTPDQVNEKHTKSNDMLKRTFLALKNVTLNKRKKYLRAYGCPVSVGDHVHYISSLGGVRNMNFHPKLVFGVNLAYLKMRIKRFLNTFL